MAVCKQWEHSSEAGSRGALTIQMPYTLQGGLDVLLQLLPLCCWAGKDAPTSGACAISWDCVRLKIPRDQEQKQGTGAISKKLMGKIISSASYDLRSSYHPKISFLITRPMSRVNSVLNSLSAGFIALFTQRKKTSRYICV